MVYLFFLSLGCMHAIIHQLGTSIIYTMYMYLLMYPFYYYRLCVMQVCLCFGVMFIIKATFE